MNTPVWKSRNVTAPLTTPASRPQNPPHADVFFQNMPRMKVAKIGALKMLNSDCR